MTKKSVNCYFDQTVILGISIRNTIKLCSTKYRDKHDRKNQGNVILIKLLFWSYYSKIPS